MASGLSCCIFVPNFAASDRPFGRLRAVEFERYSEFTTSGEILEQLRKIRLRQRIMWTVWLSYLPSVALVSFLTETGRYTGLSASGWLALGITISGFVMFSKCPRCSSLFHTTFLWGNFWVRSCIHCGLPL
jgi:hypothetical protein